MFTTEVGSSISPKFVLSVILVGMFVAAAAFTIAHNVPAHSWITLHGGR